MGFFTKLLHHEKRGVPTIKCEPMSVYAPAEGNAIPLAEFPDELFSQEVLGPGCGILPTGNLVTAPFHGTVIQTTDTMHAIGVSSDDGIELLIHVGVDTVEMDGKGFRYLVKNGQRICAGDPLIEFDRAAIQAAGHSDAIAVVVTNSDAFSAVELMASGNIEISTLLLKVQP